MPKESEFTPEQAKKITTIPNTLRWERVERMYIVLKTLLTLRKLCIASRDAHDVKRIVIIMVESFL